MIILDTNVVSELMRPSPAHAVLRWLGAQPDTELYTTTITRAEITYGIHRLPDGRRKTTMRTIADAQFAMFAETLLPFEDTAAEEFGPIRVARERAGRPIDQFDAMIAAICRATGSTLATRNSKDFEDVAIELVDPWAS